ncbi:MAG: hypothetical protein EBS51_15455 [Planctomycetia bacterium]|nr:hypothetical protein [Planctomycetia bacterium]
MATGTLPLPRFRAISTSTEERGSLAESAWTLLRAAGSLKITVVMFLAATFLLFVGTLAQDEKNLPRESLRVVLLDTRHRLIHQEEVSLGTINESLAHPREILRPAISHGAYAFVLVHNHPSGDPSPSEADRALTRRIREAADLIQIHLLDHVIIGARREGFIPEVSSMRERGIL